MVHLTFQNTVPAQIPGVIAMTLANRVAGLPSIDPNYALIVVIFNGITSSQQSQPRAGSGAG